MKCVKKEFFYWCIWTIQEEAAGKVQGKAGIPIQNHLPTLAPLLITWNWIVHLTVSQAILQFMNYCIGRRYTIHLSWGQYWCYNVTIRYGNFEPRIWSCTTNKASWMVTDLLHINLLFSALLCSVKILAALNLRLTMIRWKVLLNFWNWLVPPASRRCQKATHLGSLTHRHWSHIHYNFVFIS